MGKIVYLFLFLIVVCLIPWSFGEATTQQQFTLTVTKAGGGSGKVTSSPSGINCGSTCSGTFNQDKRVSLKAKADSGSVFTAWGGSCTGTGSCSVIMSSDVTVTATFEPKAPIGDPDISVSPDSLDFGEVEIGKKVQQALKITNTGTGDLEVNISVEGSDFSFTGKNDIKIKPQKSSNLKITFEPTREESEEELDAADQDQERTEEGLDLLPVPLGRNSARNGTFKMKTNSSKTPEKDVPVTGTAIDPLAPLTIYPDTIRISNKFHIDWLQSTSDGTATWNYDIVETGDIGVSLYRCNSKGTDCFIDCSPPSTTQSGKWWCKGETTYEAQGTVIYQGNGGQMLCTLSGFGNLEYKVVGSVMDVGADDSWIQFVLHITEANPMWSVTCNNYSSPLPGNPVSEPLILMAGDNIPRDTAFLIGSVYWTNIMPVFSGELDYVFLKTGITPEY